MNVFFQKNSSKELFFQERIPKQPSPLDATTGVDFSKKLRRKDNSKVEFECLLMSISNRSRVAQMVERVRIC